MDLTYFKRAVFWRKEEREINLGRVTRHNSTKFINFNHGKIKYLKQEKSKLITGTISELIKC